MRNESLTTPTLRGLRLVGAVICLATLLAVLLSNSPHGASAAPGDADLALTKSDSPDPVAAGANLNYTVRVQNQGPLAATNVVVTDKLAASDFDFVSASATTGGCDEQGKTVTCSLGTLNATTTATVTIIVRPKKTGTLSNTASVASPDDNTPANNQDTEDTLVTQSAGAASCANPTIAGTAGADVLVGTAGRDVIATRGGNDRVFAGDGRDLICAGSGSDFVSGGPKGDSVIGADGRDAVLGNGGNDVLRGNAGRDRLRGQRGADLLNGGANRDSCRGGPGLDTLRRCP
jgi:uncharacterized repeat protein (TIGR01451 family)